LTPDFRVYLRCRGPFYANHEQVGAVVRVARNRNEWLSGSDPADEGGAELPKCIALIFHAHRDFKAGCQ